MRKEKEGSLLVHERAIPEEKVIQELNLVLIDARAKKEKERLRRDFASQKGSDIEEILRLLLVDRREKKKRKKDCSRSTPIS